MIKLAGALAISKHRIAALIAGAEFPAVSRRTGDASAREIAICEIALMLESECFRQSEANLRVTVHAFFITIRPTRATGDVESGQVKIWRRSSGRLPVERECGKQADQEYQPGDIHHQSRYAGSILRPVKFN